MVEEKRTFWTLSAAVKRDDDALWCLVWGHLRDVKSVKSIRTDKASRSGPAPIRPLKASIRFMIYNHWMT